MKRKEKTLENWLQKLRSKLRNLLYEVEIYGLWNSLTDEISLSCKKLFKPFNRFHIKTLPNSWVDEDKLLIHLAFEPLRIYIEEDCKNSFKWKDKNLIKLYSYFKTSFRREDPWDRVIPHPNWNLYKMMNDENPSQAYRYYLTKCLEAAKIEDENYKADTAALVKLAKLRKGLWM